MSRSPRCCPPPRTRAAPFSRPDPLRKARKTRAPSPWAQRRGWEGGRAARSDPPPTAWRAPASAPAPLPRPPPKRSRYAPPRSGGLEARACHCAAGSVRSHTPLFPSQPRYDPMAPGAVVLDGHPASGGEAKTCPIVVRGQRASSGCCSDPLTDATPPFAVIRPRRWIPPSAPSSASTRRWVCAFCGAVSRSRPPRRAATAAPPCRRACAAPAASWPTRWASVRGPPSLPVPTHTHAPAMTPALCVYV